MSAVETVPKQTEVRPRRRRWLGSVLLGLVIFACGTVTGGAVTVAVVRHRLQQFLQHPEEAPDHLLPVMRSRLDLNEEQYAQVEEIVRRRHAALQEIRREAHPKVAREFDLLEEEVAAVLNPEQRQQWLSRFQYLRDTWFPAPPPAKEPQR